MPVAAKTPLLAAKPVADRLGSRRINNMGRRTTWLWAGLVWLSIGVFDASDTVFSMRAQGHHHAWAALFATLMLGWLPWAVAGPFILDLNRRFPLGFKTPAAWMVHFGFCVLLSAADAAWTAGLEELWNPWMVDPPIPYAQLLPAKLLTRFASCLVLYGAIVALGYAIDYRQRVAELQIETTRAQLDALRRQIEPHFLFNTLNGIAATVREGRNAAAIQMIAGLSTFLRGVVEGSARDEVALGEEIEFLHRYLEIQKLRFTDRLRLSLDVPEDLLGAQVPSLLLQPIVENSIKHGIAKRAQGGAIRIAAKRADGMLTLSVYNDGPNLPSEDAAIHAGTGLFNMQKRLRSLYGNTFRLTIRNQDCSGVRVSVSFPFRVV
jgi:two-component sensor histidine kinase